MNEVWKDIKGYEGYYQVSDLGRVKSLKRKGSWKDRILRYSVPQNGYAQVTLCKDSIKRTYMIHRLVASCFVENPNCYEEVNHKDENKLNNTVSNLEWCDRIYNINYGTRIERSASNRDYHTSNLKGATNHDYSHNHQFRKAVLQYDTKGNLIKRWDSVTQASKETGAKKSAISQCCNGKYKTSKNYVWKYEE